MSPSIRFVDWDVLRARACVWHLLGLHSLDVLVCSSTAFVIGYPFDADYYLTMNKAWIYNIADAEQ